MTNNAGTRGEEGAVEGLRVSVVDSTMVEDSKIIVEDTKKNTTPFVLIIFLFSSSISHAEIDI